MWPEDAHVMHYQEELQIKILPYAQCAVSNYAAEYVVYAFPRHRDLLGLSLRRYSGTVCGDIVRY